MKKYLFFIFILSGCALSPDEKKNTFKLDDYRSFCPIEGRTKEDSSKKHVVYKSDIRDFYILPGDYILSQSELSRMPQKSTHSNGNSMVKITSIEDLGDYFKNQVEGLTRLAGDIREGIFPTEIKNNYPDKKLAKELVVEKYISTENPQVVFCGLTLRSEFKAKKDLYSKYVAQQHVDDKLNDNIYSGDGGKNYFSLLPYKK